MLICRFFFGLVNSRPRARFESLRFSARCWLSGGALALVQSGGGTVDVTETMETRPVKKIY